MPAVAPGRTHPHVILPDDTCIPSEQIMIGDLLIAAETTGGGWGDRGRLNTWGSEMEVTALPVASSVFPSTELKVVVKYSRPTSPHDVINSSVTVRRGLTVWIRARSGRSKPADDNRFPHTCDYCGQAAYVGAYRVEHATQGKCAAT